MDLSDYLPEDVMISNFRLVRHLGVGLAAALAVGAPLWFAVAGLGARFGFWEYGFGLGVMTFRHGPHILFAALGVGAAALVMLVVFRVVFGRANAPGLPSWGAALAAIMVGFGGLHYANTVRETARTLPFIHDVTTDTVNPPQFTPVLIERRGLNANTVEYAGKVDARENRLLPELQAEAYPDIRPIKLTINPDRAYQAALGVAQDLGWKIATESGSAMMFEATDTTFWYGFKDDVVVRITPLETGGARVDARSVSRVGGSDLGANAARLRAFDRRLRRSVGEGA